MWDWLNYNIPNTCIPKTELRHGIVAAAAEGMAAEDAAHGEVRTLEGAVLAQGLQRVLRAGRRKAAAARLIRGDAYLVKPHQPYQRQARRLLQLC